MAVHIAFLVLAPAVLLELCRRSRILGAIGPTVLSYAAGILWGNSGWAQADNTVALNIAQVTVPLAIPYLLFATEFMRWLRTARSTVISFALEIIGVLIAAGLGAYLFADRVDEGWKLAGMFVGVYTGGTANLTAIGVGLAAKQETFILANAADMVVSSVYLLFLMSVAQRVLLKFLPPYQRQFTAASAENATESTPSIWRWDYFRDLGLATGLSVVIVGISVGIALLLTGRLSEVVIILSITTLGIAASFYARVRRLQGAQAAGQYILLVFCTAVGSTANFRDLVTSPAILYYCAFVMVVAVVIHVALAALLRIDADTVIITSTAGVFSPPFVGPVAAALKNPEVVVSGLTTGVVGYAIGNYLGLALAYLFKP
ncbi:MAG TPA: DUF819 family protein [Symbiobacteriaceae bacterium]|nr:DUF819 family protein [Symbiobacteriaceae bacterium]